MSAPVRLADLPPAGRRIVLALIEAERAARAQREAAGASASPTALTEVRRGSVDSLQS